MRFHTPNTLARALARLAAGVVAAAPLASGVLILTAPAANALTEEEIANNCAYSGSWGGQYETHVLADGSRWSSCCWQYDVGPNGECEFFLNGVSQGVWPDF